jgi:hypothetical protein
MIGLLHSYSPDAPPLPSLRDQLVVFSRPRNERDELPEEARPTLQLMDAAGTAGGHSEENVIAAEPTRVERLPIVGRVFRRRVGFDPEMKALLEDMERKAGEERGSHLISEARLLLSGLGKGRRRLYAIPTTTGEVGVYLVGRARAQVGGHVVGALPDGIDWQIYYRRDPDGTTRWVAFGLIANDVEAVDLQFDDDSVAAAVGTNAFFYEAEGQDPHSVTAFVLHLNDGTLRRVATDRT